MQRKRRGSLRDVAEEVGITMVHLSRLERGVHKPRRETAAKLAHWLGWSVEQVLQAATTPASEAERRARPAPLAPSKNRLGRELQRRRGRRRRSDVAAEIGIHASQVRILELGESVPSLPTVWKLHRWLGWPVEDVISAAMEEGD